MPHPPCPAPINLFLARGVGPIPLPNLEIKGAQGDLGAVEQIGRWRGRSRFFYCVGSSTSAARGDAKNPAGGHAHAVFTLLRLCVSTVEDRGDATAWRETLRPHGNPVRPEPNGGIYYEVVRSKGMYLLRRSPQSSSQSRNALA